jgi:hypothetical protein
MGNLIDAPMTNYRTTVKPIKRLSTILFVIGLDILMVLKIRESASFNSTSFIYLAIGLVVSLIVFQKLFSELRIIILTDTLLVQKQILNISYKTDTYEIREMSDLRKINDESENTYWNFGGILLSDKTQEVLTFRHKEKFIKIGLGFNWTNIEEVINEIRKRKK